MMLKPIERQSLAQTVMIRLLDFIRTGEIQPGEALPSQQELAELLSVSRPVLREAMQGLAAIGIVEIRHGIGCYVRHAGAGDDEPAWLETLSHQGALEVLEARMVVEVELAAFAALRATAEDFAEMEAILERLQRSMARGRPTAQITSDFHQALARAGHNRPLARMAQMLSQARIVQGMRVEHALPDIAAAEYDSHRILLDVVGTRDPDRARAAMREHLEIAHGCEERVNALRGQIEAATPPAGQHDVDSDSRRP